VLNREGTHLASEVTDAMEYIYGNTLISETAH